MAPLTEPDDPGAEQPFVSHLIELRDRLLRMVVAVFIALLAIFPFANKLYTYVAAPLLARLPEGSTMIATQVASPFLTPFKLALVAAVFVSMPYLLYQIWGFVAPGLYRHEKRLAMPLLASSIVLFYLGMAFAYFVVFPLVFAFMAGTTPEGAVMMTDIASYLDFVLALFFAFGVAFEIPIATILLVATGATTPAALGSKRPYVIVGVFIAGMLLTPPDVISQTLLALPMWLLFEVGIIASRILLRQRAAREAVEPDPDPDPDPELGRAVASAPTPDSGPMDAQTRGGAAVVGREIDGGGIEDEDRWRPLTDVEMEEELDLLDADESLQPATKAPAAPAADPVEEKIQRANRLRELGNAFAARVALYEVLEEGDESQRRVARNILKQLDED